MLITSTITEQPLAGQYKEMTYDAPSLSYEWTWVKFEDENYNENYGQFRGSPKKVALSLKHAKCYVLTSDYLYEIDCQDPSNYKVRDYWDCGSVITNLTVSPNGDIILADDYTIFAIGHSFDEKTTLESPIPMDLIEFQQWDNQRLHISCFEFLTDIKVELKLDAITMTISKK